MLKKFLKLYRELGKLFSVLKKSVDVKLYLPCRFALIFEEAVGRVLPGIFLIVGHGCTKASKCCSRLYIWSAFTGGCPEIKNGSPISMISNFLSFIKSQKILFSTRQSLMKSIFPSQFSVSLTLTYPLADLFSVYMICPELDSRAFNQTALSKQLTS